LRLVHVRRIVGSFEWSQQLVVVTVGENIRISNSSQTNMVEAEKVGLYMLPFSRAF
jgi:hypothetical protein